MSYSDLLSEISNRTNDAIAAEQWESARVGLRDMARVLVDATVAGESELVARVDEALAEIYTGISIDDAFVPELSLMALGWSTDGIRDVAQLARRRRPPMTNEQRISQLRNAQARIVKLLAEGNARPRSNREIAEALDLHVATVARALVELRKTKRVKSWPEGRLMMNQAVVGSSVDSIEVSNARALEEVSDTMDSAASAAGHNPRLNSPATARLVAKAHERGDLAVAENRILQSGNMNTIMPVELLGENAEVTRAAPKADTYPISEDFEHSQEALPPQEMFGMRNRPWMNSVAAISAHALARKVSP